MDGLTPGDRRDDGARTGRRRWMSVLAKADGADIRQSWEDLDDKPGYRLLRAPETGLTMVRARAGGTGRPFNFSEMTVTRCVVELADGIAGHAYVAGTDPAHAEIAAVFDALMQDPARAPEIESSVITPLERKHLGARADAASRTAATRVDFFTMVRGED